MPSPELKKELELLVKKYRQGKATPAEIAFLEQYYDHFEKESAILPTLTADKREQLELRMLQQIEAQISQRDQPKIIPLHKKTFFRIAAAAAIVTILSAGIYLYLIRTLPVDTSGNNNGITLLQKDRPPGKEGAILTLADGSVIVLDSAQNGALAVQGNVQVVKQDNGQLTYLAPSVSNPANTPVVLNTLATPRGRQFQVTLPDGSRVWLNAASSIRYPTAFTGRERKVEITGEAYFEVAKDPSKPFIVTSKALTVSVLGTHFNINAYEDEAAIHTTLLEGAVKVNNGNSTVQLKPGEQASWQYPGTAGKSTGIQVHDANTDEAIAWKNGHFEFNGNIRGIMRQIARWYDVEIQYAGNVTDKALGGAIARTENISQVLNMLQLTGSIHCTLEGRVVTVTP